MGIYLEILLAIVVCGIVFALFYIARGAMLTPVPVSNGSLLYTVIAAGGAAENLQQTVNGLLWLGDSGTLKGTVVILDRGMPPAARKAAELLSKDNARVVLVTPHELALLLESL